MAKPRFPGPKEQPSAEAVLLSAGELGAQLNEALDRAADPVSAIVTLGALFARPLAESGYRDRCPVATAVTEAAGDHPATRAACSRAYTGWLEALAARLQRWGVPQDEAGPLAEVVLSGIQGALLLAKARQDCAPLHTVTTRLGALVAAAARPAP